MLYLSLLGSDKLKKNKKAIIISSSILVGILILFYVVAVIIYNVSFNYRCTSDEALMCKMEDFDNLERKRYEFETKKGNNLVGYLYSNEIIEEKGLVVFAHGLGGGGQRGYLDIFDYLSSNGYYVFAYDATANDESEGKVIGGLPQGIIDLDYAINFTKTIEEVKDLPLMLMGYSWGGLSVSNVLNYHDEVKAVVAISGWNKSLNLIEYHGCQMVGPLGKLLLPFASVHEHIKYGKYASSTAMKAFEKTNAKIMIVHSEDDTTVPIEYGYDTYYEKYSSDDRFIFKHYTNRGHNDIFKSEEGAKYYNGFIDELNDFKRNEVDLTKEKILHYIDKNLDREKLASKLDYELFAEIIEMYNSCLN